MLVERYRQLLTAYVDGELSSRQRRHVARLLRRSPEARQLLQRLQQDARCLRHLPRPPMPVDLSGAVLRGIAERRLTPGRSRLAKISAPTSWAGPFAAWAAAAAVLIVLGMASYLYFAASLTHTGKTQLARREPDSSPHVIPPPREPEDGPKAKSPPAAVHEKPAPKLEHSVTIGRPEIVKRPGEKSGTSSPGAPPRPAKEESALTDRLEMFRYDKVEDNLPVIVKVSELDREALRKGLLAELRKAANFRLELPCRNGSKAFERVRAVANRMKLGLIVEKRAQDRLKQPKWKTNYVVYIENLTPDELAAFVRRIGAEDRKLASRKPAEAQFDRLVLTRMTPKHHKELSTLLGVDPTVLAPAAKGALDADPRKPLADLTAQQIGKSLAGQGGTPRPEAGKPPEHYALVLAYNPVRPDPRSPEIKRFLESRKAAKPGTLRVLLVLRG